MSQATNFGVPLSGPATPAKMAEMMDESLGALLSVHSGASRPHYAVPGTVWLNTATVGQHKYYCFDGETDRLLYTVNMATGAVTFADLGQTINAAAAKVVIADADKFGIVDTAGGNKLKRVSLVDLITSIFDFRTIDGGWFWANTFRLRDNVDNTKKLQFDTSKIGTGQTRVLSMANADVDLARVNNLLGYDQTWQDMAGSRAGGTSYQNTTGRPIMVALRVSTSTTRNAEVSANGTTWVPVGVSNSVDNESISFIVPNGWYYRLNGVITSIAVWSELR